MWEGCRTPWKGEPSFAGSNKKTLQSIFFKKSIVQKKKRAVGPQNAAFQLFLAAFQVQVSEHVFYLIIILNSKFLNNFSIQREDSLKQMLKQSTGRPLYVFLLTKRIYEGYE